MSYTPDHMTDELLASYLLNECDPEVSKYVEKWIIESPANRNYFDHFKTIWDASRELVLPSSVDENAAWERFRSKTFNAATPVVSIGNKFSRLYRIAAILIACATLVAAGYVAWDWSDRSVITVSTAARTETRTLPDGSQVILNKNSSLSYTRKLAGKSRNIELKGEAFFNVKPDKEKPFIIDVNDVKITVLGTSFNIKGYQQKTEIIVETGVVKVQTTARSQTLKAGEKIVIDSTGTMGMHERTTDRLHQYYQTRQFVCDNTPLWKLVEVLNDAYESQIIIGNDALRQLPLTTTFNNEPLDNILKVIAETFDITIHREQNTIILK